MPFWWPCPRSIPNLPEVRIAPGVGVVVIGTPVRPNSNSAEFRSSAVLYYSFCDVTIEQALGSLPYPRQSGFPTVW